MKAIYWIWLFFTAIFTVLAIFSFYLSKSPAREIKPFTRPMDNMGTVRILGADIDAPIKAFLIDFNRYIRDYNKSTSRQNLLAGFGYIAAAIVSAVSFFMAMGWIK